jgi:catechol 2,3-dioxygenase-like lactoylglutathione lyase family enzyme
MSTIQMETQTGRPGPKAGDFPLEVVVLPVSDVDRAKRFYTSLGWRPDADYAAGDEFRVVQMTPPGSMTSVIFGKGLTTAAPGSVARMLLVVNDIDAARDELVGRGVEVSGVFHRERSNPAVPGKAPGDADYGSFAAFSDPDGNGWVLQQVKRRLPERVDDVVGASGPAASEFRLEQISLPVADIDRAKEFYSSLGWRLDADFDLGQGVRVVQLTPPGSGASIGFGGGRTAPGTGPLQGLVIAVADIEAARDELVASGVNVSEVWHDAGGVFFHAGTAARVPGAADGHADYSSFATFTDPDGNGWVLQEIKRRLPGR